MKNPNSRAAVARKIQRLQNVADALAAHAEYFFFINRLTVIKSLCVPPDAATAFALDLARRTVAQMRQSPEKLPHELALARRAVKAIHACHQSPTLKNTGNARILWYEVQRTQNEIIRPMVKYPVRVIKSMRLLGIENALGCATFPDAAPDWTYRAARTYTERYNSHFGTGLIPESLPFLLDVIRFWKKYYDLETK